MDEQTISSILGPRYKELMTAAKAKWSQITDETRINITSSEVDVDLSRAPIVVEHPIGNLRMEFRPTPLVEGFDADYSLEGDMVLFVSRVPKGTFAPKKSGD
jgi:hypothetical protein